MLENEHDDQFVLPSVSPSLKSDNKTEESTNISFAKSDELNAFRNRLNIRVKGNDICSPCSSFRFMNIHQYVKPTVLENIELGKWKEPTPIQMQAIPCLIAGRDIMATAPTGSGKTAAFVIPALSLLASRREEKKGIKVLLLAPTKELADQIYREVLRLSQGKRFKFCLLKKKGISNAVSSQVYRMYSV